MAWQQCLGRRNPSPEWRPTFRENHLGDLLVDVQVSTAVTVPPNEGFTQPAQDLEKGARCYAAIWHSSVRFSSTEFHGLRPAEHRAHCQELVAQGYRPASISVAEIEPGTPLVAASVWQRPLVADRDKEHLAKRQAAAAVALLRLGEGQKVWPLFKNSPDPRARSYLIDWLRPLGADPDVLLRRLPEEADVSARRALLLGLGEFGDKELPADARESLLPRLWRLYRDDPDPGIHGVAGWLLRQWQQEPMLKEMNQTWAKDHDERARRLSQIRQETAKEPGQAKPQWYVNSQGQTMVVIPGPVEFLMGSPRTEAGHVPHERIHRRRIGRTFALATAPVTVEQFLRFQPSFDYIREWVPSPDCPVGGAPWYLAAEYCNWLSQQEGLPETEWCYQPNEHGRYAEGMTLAPDYLRRTGYRLPTEAEWEFACRAGAITSRSYGETDELLGKYAWYVQNSGARTHPVATRKPNDLGLFDMHGNVWTWCQELGKDVPASRRDGLPTVDREEDLSVKDSQRRFARGGSIPNPAVDVRAAYHMGPFVSAELPNVGIRPERTFR